MGDLHEPVVGIVAVVLLALRDPLRARPGGGGALLVLLTHLVADGVKGDVASLGLVATVVEADRVREPIRAVLILERSDVTARARAADNAVAPVVCCRGCVVA